MKKMLFCLCLLGATALYANDKYDALEEKIELQLKKEIKSASGDYEVDIYDENGSKNANVKLEISGIKIRKGANYDIEAKQTFEILEKNGIKNKNFYVESDNVTTEDEIVYEKTEIK